MFRTPDSPYPYSLRLKRSGDGISLLVELVRHDEVTGELNPYWTLGIFRYHAEGYKFVRLGGIRNHAGVELDITGKIKVVEEY